MGRRKMKYCIEFRDMSTGLHMLACYDSRKEAESWENYILSKRNTPQFKFSVDECINKAVRVFDINFRDIVEEYYIYKGQKKMRKKYDEEYIIINLISYDIYL